MEIFFEIIQSLKKLDLIIEVNKQTRIYAVNLYSVLKDQEQIVVSQTKPPLSKKMINTELEVSFIAKLKEDRPERFFFLVKIDKIDFFRLNKYRFVEAIFISPIQKKIYKKSLRKYERINCKGMPLFVIFEEKKFQVIDISKGGLCFICEKKIENSLRFVPKKKIHIILVYSDKIKIPVTLEIIRRFEKEDETESLLIGGRFIDEERMLSEIIDKLLES